MINTPCIASIGHFFLRRRGNATGIAMTSGSLGGIIFPLMLQKLLSMVGFAWATRILGFILVFLLVVANLLVRSRLPRKPVANFRSVSPDMTVFRDLPFAFVTLGIFLMEWGIFVPLSFITSFVISHGHGSTFGFQILAILNAGSVLGRFFAGRVAGKKGNHFSSSHGNCEIYYPSTNLCSFLYSLCTSSNFFRYDRSNEHSHSQYRSMCRVMFCVMDAGRRIYRNDNCLRCYLWVRQR
jgi:MFS family permease